MATQIGITDGSSLYCALAVSFRGGQQAIRWEALWQWMCDEIAALNATPTGIDMRVLDKSDSPRRTGYSWSKRSLSRVEELISGDNLSALGVYAGDLVDDGMRSPVAIYCSYDARKDHIGTLALQMSEGALARVGDAYKWIVRQIIDLSAFLDIVYGVAHVFERRVFPLFAIVNAKQDIHTSDKPVDVQYVPPRQHWRSVPTAIRGACWVNIVNTLHCDDEGDCQRALEASRLDCKALVRVVGKETFVIGSCANPFAQPEASRKCIAKAFRGARVSLRVMPSEIHADPRAN